MAYLYYTLDIVPLEYAATVTETSYSCDDIGDTFYSATVEVDPPPSVGGE